jgi:hypothetical protein
MGLIATLGISKLSFECHYAEFCHAECRYAECRHAVCRYAECRHANCRGALSIFILGSIK